MPAADLITPNTIACGVKASSKKRALEALSALLAANGSGLIDTEIFESLIMRERLGSTGIGHGVAIPHGRLKGVKSALGAFVQLEQGVDFDAIDNGPVDLMFALLVPVESTDEHLQLLAQLAEMFSDASLRERLREAESVKEIYELLRTQAQQVAAGGVRG